MFKMHKMEQGSISERILERSVIKHIKKQNNVILSGAGVGRDYSEVAIDTDSGRFVVTDGCSFEPWIAWTKALNNFSCSGGYPVGARISAILSVDMDEQDIRSCMKEFGEYARASEIWLTGGHTEVDAQISRARYIVTIFGHGGSYAQSIGDIRTGNDIIMVGYAGKLGTFLLAEKKRYSLRERFAESYIDGAICQREDFDISNAAKLIASNKGVYYLHDVSCGGIYGALEQLAVGMDRGIEIWHDKILIRQETIEFSEFYGINPYMLEGTGALLAVSDNGEAMVKQLKENDIKAAVIGKVTDGHDRTVVINEIEKRYLTLTSGDDIYKALADI